MSPVRVNVKPSCPDRKRFQTVESGVVLRKSIISLIGFSVGWKGNQLREDQGERSKVIGTGFEVFPAPDTYNLSPRTLFSSQFTVLSSRFIVGVIPAHRVFLRV